jgi:hypothetical protein
LTASWDSLAILSITRFSPWLQCSTTLIRFRLQNEAPDDFEQMVAWPTLTALRELHLTIHCYPQMGDEPVGDVLPRTAHSLVAASKHPSNWLADALPSQRFVGIRQPVQS